MRHGHSMQIKDLHICASMMRTLAAVLLASLMLFGGAAAQAHDELVSSDPAANATLTQAPAELNLTYSANLMNIEGGNRVRVVDSTGAIRS